MARRMTYTTQDGREMDAGRNADEVVRRRRRWDPLKAGTLTVARIEVIRDSNGEVRVVEGKSGFLAIDMLLHLDAAPGERGFGRRGIRCRIVIGGNTPALMERQKYDRAQVMRAASCHWKVWDREMELGRRIIPDDLDGLRVPIELGIEISFSTGQPQNTATILSADSNSATYDRYVALARSLEPTKVVSWKLVDGEKVPDVVVDSIPGWRMYEGSPAHRLMTGRIDGKYARREKSEISFEMRVQTKREGRKVAPRLDIVKRADAPSERAIERMARNVGMSLADTGFLPSSTASEKVVDSDPARNIPISERGGEDPFAMPSVDPVEIDRLRRTGGRHVARPPIDKFELARRGAAKRLQEDMVFGGFRADQMRRK